MATLGEISKIEQNITNAKLRAIEVLHKIAYGKSEQPRVVRRKVRKFSGFRLEENSQEYAEIVSNVESNFDVSDLVTVSHILDLNYDVDKDKMVDRICTFLNNLEIEKVDGEEEEEEDENEDEDDNGEGDEDGNAEEECDSENIPLSQLRARQQKSSKQSGSFSLTFRDVEDSIRTFNGKEDYPVEKWISDFEDIADVTRWNDLQKLIFAKKSLTGIAKLFVQSEKGIKSWATLKRKLLEEFKVTVSSAHIHKLLMERKKNASETLQEYALVMREIGSRALLAQDIIIQYIVDGVKDESANKIILYGAKNFTDFKEKIKLYDQIKLKETKNNSGKTENKPKWKGNERGDSGYNMDNRRFQPRQQQLGQQRRTIRDGNQERPNNCFNCGQMGHRSANCPDRTKGCKCFKCGEFGHIAPNCTKKSTENQNLKRGVHAVEVVPKNAVKVYIENICVTALFDTGSDISAIRRDVYENHFQDIPLTAEKIKINGIGSNRVETLGYFKKEVGVNDERVTLTFHVIPINSSGYRAIIGNDILDQVEVNIKNGAVEVYKRSKQNYLMEIRVSHEENEVDVGNIESEKIRNEVKNMIENYKPYKTKSTEIKMKLVLKDDEPVYQSPRRLSVNEREEVDKQTEEWLQDGIIQPSCSDYASPIVLVRKKDGSRMAHVDTLSRYPAVMAINKLTSEESGMVQRLKMAQEQDEYVKAVRKIVTTEDYQNFMLKNDILYKYEDGLELIVVPKPMQMEIIRKAHEIGHFAVTKTEETIKREFYIPKLTEKIQACIKSCVTCILGSRKEGKKEGLLHPIAKGEGPLNTYHIDHLGPLPSTNKNYQHILAVIDDFSKFVWLYATKSTTSRETLDKLRLQQKTFGNPARIISDKGTAFTSKEFQEYCEEEGIDHVTITTGVPRGNGQIERINRIIIPVLTKLSLDDPNKWYKHTDRTQRALNSTLQRSILATPFEVLVGVKMRNKEDILIKEMLEKESIETFNRNRDELRDNCKRQILKVQEENRNHYNLRRRKPRSYKVGELVAIKRTQFGAGLKLHKKYLGPYEVSKVKPNERYDLVKVGNTEGPCRTSSCAEYMKPWVVNFSESESDC